ncbi:hypothetical protein JMF97_28825 [Micromonospora fiedleri]|uniref:Uncharacterized protein n=1 Tax=Micromonospora fiedleri TaxID=1157498 RepID=A0ABS1UUX4_9ACTN|nr:hypothetical protein [Micromonospora fiedleri]MBL6280173.1 hypothetical protein [Micromonospora fiedleri]
MVGTINHNAACIHMRLGRRLAVVAFMNGGSNGHQFIIRGLRVVWQSVTVFVGGHDHLKGSADCQNFSSEYLVRTIGQAR